MSIVHWLYGILNKRLTGPWTTNPTAALHRQAARVSRTSSMTERVTPTKTRNHRPVGNCRTCASALSNISSVASLSSCPTSSALRSLNFAYGQQCNNLGQCFWRVSCTPRKVVSVGVERIVRINFPGSNRPTNSPKPPYNTSITLASSTSSNTTCTTSSSSWVLGPSTDGSCGAIDELQLRKRLR